MLTTTCIITTIRATSERAAMSPYPMVASVTTVKYRALVRLRFVERVWVAGRHVDVGQANTTTITTRNWPGRRSRWPAAWAERTTASVCQTTMTQEQARPTTTRMIALASSLGSNGST